MERISDTRGETQEKRRGTSGEEAEPAPSWARDKTVRLPRAGAASVPVEPGGHPTQPRQMANPGNHPQQSAHSCALSLKCHVRCRSRVEVRLAVSPAPPSWRIYKPGNGRRDSEGGWKSVSSHSRKVLAGLATPVGTIDPSVNS